MSRLPNKFVFPVLGVLLIGVLLFALVLKKNKNRKLISYQNVEVSCGKCQFGMKSTSCKLATKIQGKYYWIKGTDIDDHGDAHGPEGFCNHVLYADLSGHLVQSDILFVEKFNLK